MIDLGPHAAFIVAAFLGVAVLIAGLVSWVMWDAGRVQARLKALEDRGIRRRSAGPAA
jgi:heme exporter protein D